MLCILIFMDNSKILLSAVWENISLLHEIPKGVNSC